MEVIFTTLRDNRHFSVHHVTRVLITRDGPLCFFNDGTGKEYFDHSEYELEQIKEE